MPGLLPAVLVKLPLALAVFLVIAYAGTINRRIAGVLFTFPILNGVAIIASPQPAAVAQAIYPLVIFNCVLFATVISFPHALPPASDTLPRSARLFWRVIIWSLAWLAGAFALTEFHDALPGGLVLFVAAAIFAAAFMRLTWTPQPRDETRRAATGFLVFWGNRTGLSRILFFCATYAALVLVASRAGDQKWVGMASALPLPGFFALATLIDSGAAADVRPIRDTLFLGPLLVIPFNAAFSQLVIATAAAPAVLRYGLLLVLWAIAALAVVLIVPRIAAHLDVRR